MSKTKNIFTKYGIILSVVLMVLLLSIPLVFKSNAGALPQVYLYLSRIKADIAGGATDPVDMVLAFSTGQAIDTKGTLTIVFPDEPDGKWCRATGALTVTGVTAASPDQGDWAIDAALPNDGTLTATCSIGAGANSSDTITITNIGALTANTVYGVKLSDGSSAGRLGTGATAGVHNITVEIRKGTKADSSTFGVHLVTNDEVVINANVSASPSVTCTISTNTVNLGSMYPGGAFTTGQHTISTSTSASAGGYYWAVYGKGNGTDAGLWKSNAATHLIPSTGSTDIDLRGVGTEGFGMTASDPDAAGSGATVATTFTDAILGVFGALDSGVSGAKLLLSQIGAQVDSEASTITYGAKAGTTAPAGSYTETVTFICGGYY